MVFAHIDQCHVILSQFHSVTSVVSLTPKGGGVGYFPYKRNPKDVLTTCKAISRVLPADLCTDHAHYVKNHRSTVLKRNKNMAVEGGTVSHYYILVIRKFIDFMSLFRHSVWFSFSVKQFPSADFGICNTAPYSC